MNGDPPPLNVLVGALESEFGLHGACGYELRSHSAMDIHGAGVSSNQCDTSLPGVLSVGAALGSAPIVSVKLMLPPEPGLEDSNVVSGSSWPMYWPLS